MSQPKGKVRLYAAGGCGTNIGAQLEQFRDKTEVAFAVLDIVYVDTSKSNLRPEINPDNCYFLEDLDGSGKVRKENHEQINLHVRAILQKFSPADLNIVLHSTGGGSGSVIGPLLVSELLASNAPTIVIAVGSSQTVLDADNTLKTLKSYEAISRARNAPVVMSYSENNATSPRAFSDKSVSSTIMALAVLFSRENLELDSKDLFNFLRYDRVTKFPVQLTSLTLVEGKQSMNDLGTIITMATLVKDGESADMEQIPEVQYVGILPEKSNDLILANAPMHFITSDGILPGVNSRLQKLLNGAEKTRNARLGQNSLLSNSDHISETGLVL